MLDVYAMKEMRINLGIRRRLPGRSWEEAEIELLHALILGLGCAVLYYGTRSA